MNGLPQFEDKSVAVLRRKFLVGIPTFGILGYVGSRAVTHKFGISGWRGRGLRILATIVSPVIGSMLIVHFNRGEIFRIGGSMLRDMETLRQREEGPFADANVREKWDQQMSNRKFNLLKPDSHISQEFESGISYEKIVDDSIGRR
jgi:hypothetical protein